jgi:enterochelin esterase-like enzyme
MRSAVDGTSVRRRACRSLLALIAVCCTLPAFAASSIIAREFDSATLQRKWSYTVYLPSGYERAAQRYPVVYLLHGHAQDRQSWVNSGGIQATADALIAKREIPAVIIVMPDAGTSWYVDRKEKMETALIRDLIPDVEKQFRALSARDGRLIGGLSMGGYGALRFVMKYPEMFAAAALLSPAIYDPEPPESSGARRVGVFGSPNFDATVWKELNYPSLWEAYRAKNTPVPMYISSGDDDEYFIESDAAKLYALLRKNRQPAELRIVDGAHTWPVWAGTVGDALRYICRFSAPALAASEAKQKPTR